MAVRIKNDEDDTSSLLSKYVAQTREPATTKIDILQLKIPMNKKASLSEMSSPIVDNLTNEYEVIYDAGYFGLPRRALFKWELPGIV